MPIVAATSGQEGPKAHHDWVIAATVMLCATCNALWEDEANTLCPGDEGPRRA